MSMKVSDPAETMPMGLFTNVKPMPAPGRHYLVVALMINSRTMTNPEAVFSVNVTLTPIVDACGERPRSSP